MLSTIREQKIFVIRKAQMALDHFFRVKKGQVILEFTLCMIVILLMIFGLAKVFHWAGRDLVERQRAHDAVLKYGVGSGPDRLKRISQDFYAPVRMNAVWNGS